MPWLSVSRRHQIKTRVNTQDRNVSALGPCTQGDPWGPSPAVWQSDVPGPAQLWLQGQRLMAPTPAAPVRHQGTVTCTTCLVEFSSHTHTTFSFCCYLCGFWELWGLDLMLHARDERDYVYKSCFFKSL